MHTCSDYKVTINSSLDIDQYPLSKPEDVFASLTGGVKFTVLDLLQAYNQLLLTISPRSWLQLALIKV